MDERWSSGTPVGTLTAMTANSPSGGRAPASSPASLTHAVRAAAGSQRDLVKLSLLARPGVDARKAR